MIINKIVILDTENKEVNEFPFSPSSNIVCATSNANANKKGKSSLLKLIYYTLGLDIKDIDKNWGLENLITKITYTHNNKEGYIIRYKKNVYYVSGEKGYLKQADYDDWLRKLFSIDFKLILKSNEDLYLPNSSAFLFPYYIDQEKSWGGRLYKHLNNTDKYKRGEFPEKTLRYLLEIDDDYLVKLQLDKHILQEKIRDINKQKYALDTIKDKILQVQNFEYEFNEADLKENIDKYINLSQDLSNNIATYKSSIYELKNQINERQININELEKILKKDEEDYKTVKNCTCTHCNSTLTIEQSIKRMDIEYSQFKVKQFILENNNKIDELNKKIEIKLRERAIEENKYKELLKVANIKSGNLTLEEYLKLKSYDYIKENFSQIKSNLILEGKDISKDIINIDKEIKKIKKELENREKELKDSFNKLNENITLKLPLSRDTDINFFKFAEIKETGGGTVLSQTILSIYLMYISLLIKVNRIEFPFGIDDIIQGSTGEDNIKFIYEQLDEHVISQNIQSFSVMLDDKFKYIKNIEKHYRIDLSNHSKLLSKDKFEELKEEFSEIFQPSLDY